MQIANINFKQRTGKFALSSGANGTAEKQLILDSIDVWTIKITSSMVREPGNNEAKLQNIRFAKARFNFESLVILENDLDFELLDDATNIITYHDLADAMTAIHDHIRVLEDDGTYLTDNVEKYATLKRLLNELNETKTKFVRIPTRPMGLAGRRH